MMATDNTRSGPLCSRLLRTLCVLVMLCLLITSVPTATRPDYDGAYPRYTKQEIRRAIAWYARKYRLDPALLRAVIKTESDFHQHAVSHKGAVGLMQLTPATAARVRVIDVYDSMQNIRGGATQLRHLLNLYQGDLPLALAASAITAPPAARSGPRSEKEPSHVCTILVRAADPRRHRCRTAPHRPS